MLAASPYSNRAKDAKILKKDARISKLEAENKELRMDALRKVDKWVDSLTKEMKDLRECLRSVADRQGMEV